MVDDRAAGGLRPPGRTQRERRAETEHRVLEAALRLIAEGGARSMSLAQVGEEAGYSRGIVTHQFGSRRKLLRRAAEYAQRAVALPDGHVHGLERLVAFVGNYLDSLVTRAPAGHAFLLMWVEAVASEPGLREVYKERDEWFRRQLADIVSQGIEEGSVRSDVDPAAVAVVLVGQLRGLGLQLMLAPDLAAYAQVRGQAVDLVRRWLSSEPPGPPGD